MGGTTAEALREGGWVGEALGCPVALTGVLQQLGGDGHPTPLALGNATCTVGAHQAVCHVAQTQLGQYRLHLGTGQMRGPGREGPEQPSQGTRPCCLLLQPSRAPPPAKARHVYAAVQGS